MLEIQWEVWGARYLFPSKCPHFLTTLAEFYDPCIYGYSFDGRKYSYVWDIYKKVDSKAFPCTCRSWFILLGGRATLPGLWKGRFSHGLARGQVHSLQPSRLLQPPRHLPTWTFMPSLPHLQPFIASCPAFSLPWHFCFVLIHIVPDTVMDILNTSLSHLLEGFFLI